jgi:hypothetical protein
MEQSYFEDGALREQKSTGPSLVPHRTQYTYDANGNMVSVGAAGNLSEPFTPNISSIIFNYTTQNDLKESTETIFPPTGGGVTTVSEYAYQADGLLAYV